MLLSNSNDIKREMVGKSDSDTRVLGQIVLGVSHSAVFKHRRIEFAVSEGSRCRIVQLRFPSTVRADERFFWIFLGFFGPFWVFFVCLESVSVSQ